MKDCSGRGTDGGIAAGLEMPGRRTAPAAAGLRPVDSQISEAVPR